MSGEPRRRVSRRAVLGALGAAAVAVATGGVLVRDRWWFSGSEPDSRPDVEGIPRIGYAYLAYVPGEADRGELRALLADAGAPGLTGDETELVALHSVVRDDARDGNLVIIDGWVLSVNEARAAALVALTHQ